MPQQRYEKEIEDILRKAEEAGWGKVNGAAPRPQETARPLPPNRSNPTKPKANRRSVRWTPGSILAAVAIFTLLVIILSPIDPSRITLLLRPLAVLALIGAVIYYFSQSGRTSPPPGEKRWRGQPIQFEQPETPFERIASTLRRWLNRR